MTSNGRKARPQDAPWLSKGSVAPVKLHSKGRRHIPRPRHRVTNWSPARYLVRASLATAPRAASDQSARLALRPSYDRLASGSGVPLFRTLNSISHTFRSRIGCSSLAPIESIRLNLSAHFAAFHSGRGEYLREQSANWAECLLRLSLRRTITSVVSPLVIQLLKNQRLPAPQPCAKSCRYAGLRRRTGRDPIIRCTVSTSAPSW